jgi:endo-1,4-beta-D-glucanase Y
MLVRDHLPKLSLMFALLIVYFGVAAVLFSLVAAGVIERAPLKIDDVDLGTDSDIGFVPIDKTTSLQAAIGFVDGNLRKPNGHINLYLPLYTDQNISQHNHTNSEAVSYYLLIMAQQGDKKRFDEELQYIRRYMIHPEAGYMRWRPDDADIVVGEGENIAPDADLRALRALYIAKDLWGDKQYDVMIDTIAGGLERVAIDKNGVLVAYGGWGNGKAWRGNESFLAYSDFQVLDRLANTRGGVWIKTAEKMRNVTLDAQIWNGLYNSVYFSNGGYGTHIDGGVYSINSLWIMTRFAESGDPVLVESARKSLKFYQDEYAREGKIYIAYDSSGKVANEAESPWNYALIARAAKELGEDSFAQLMEKRMLDYQNLDSKSDVYGGIVEGAMGDERVGQFTMQESILTMQTMQGKSVKFD